jgi:hypothetical protein
MGRDERTRFLRSLQGMEADVGFIHFAFHRADYILMIRWDEWVPASRLLKMDETNCALQQSLKVQAKIQTSLASSSKHGKSHGAGGASNSKEAISSRPGVRKDGTRGTKRGREDVCISTHSKDDQLLMIEPTTG